MRNIKTYNPGSGPIVGMLNVSLRTIYCFPAILLLSSGLLFSCGHASVEGAGADYMIQREPETFHYETTGSTTQIKYYKMGSGDPVILLHGFASSSFTWLHIAEALSRNHTVFALDLKGFGLSDKPADTRYSLRDQADIVRRLILERNMKDVAIVGHSLGGAVTLLAYDSLLEEKRRVRRMVLIDTFIQDPVLSTRMKIGILPLVGYLGIRLLPTNLYASIILRSSYLDSSKIQDQTLRAYAHYIGLPGASHAITETARKLFHEPPRDLVGIATEAEIPVLIIWGDKDPVFPLVNGEVLVKGMRKAQLLVIEECGHIPQEEKPAETLHAIEDFLNNNTK
jgi:pimeloyl-ACP methyl ester carboxylesterase